MFNVGMSPDKPLYVEKEFEVRTYDIDFASVVGNIVYIRWLEDLRLKLLATYAPLKDQLNLGQGPILTKTTIEYKKPITIFDKPIGKMWLSDLGQAHWAVQAEFWVGDTLCCAAEQSGAYIDFAKARPIPVPEKLRQQYQKWADSATRKA
jgi:acyl-CoA thioester hydrolase